MDRTRWPAGRWVGRALVVTPGVIVIGFLAALWWRYVPLAVGPALMVVGALAVASARR